jgi:hypothetical protein
MEQWKAMEYGNWNVLKPHYIYMISVNILSEKTPYSFVCGWRCVHRVPKSDC